MLLAMIDNEDQRAALDHGRLSAECDVVKEHERRAVLELDFGYPLARHHKVAVRYDFNTPHGFGGT